MGQTATQIKYFTKIVQFNGQKMTLFSLDGNTWSTRKMELAEIVKRHELQRAELAGKAEEAEAAAVTETEPVKSEDEDLREDDGKPFSISEDEDDNESGGEKGRARLRAKSGKTVAKLPAKPNFNKSQSKPEIKISPKKKESAKVVAVKVKEKPKKAAKLTIAKSAGKKSKAVANKKRKAA